MNTAVEVRHVPTERRCDECGEMSDAVVVFERTSVTGPQWSGPPPELAMEDECEVTVCKACLLLAVVSLGAAIGARDGKD